MNWKQVTSSNLRAYRYDPSTMNLDIQFKNGSVYTYKNVPLSTVKGIDVAQSVGEYFSSNIKSSFEYERLS